MKQLPRNLKKANRRAVARGPERQKTTEALVAEKVGELLIAAQANEIAMAQRAKQQRYQEELTKRGQIAASLPHSHPAELHMHATQEEQARRALEVAHEARDGQALLAEIDKKRAATLLLGQRVATKLQEHGLKPSHLVVVPAESIVSIGNEKHGGVTLYDKVATGWRIPFRGPTHPGGHLLLLENGDILGFRGSKLATNGKAVTFGSVRGTYVPLDEKVPTFSTQEGSYSPLDAAFESDITRPVYTPLPTNPDDWATIEARGIVVAQHESGTQEGLFRLYQELVPSATDEQVLLLGRTADPTYTPTIPSRPRTPE